MVNKPLKRPAISEGRGGGRLTGHYRFETHMMGK